MQEAGPPTPKHPPNKQPTHNPPTTPQPQPHHTPTQHNHTTPNKRTPTHTPPPTTTTTPKTHHPPKHTPTHQHTTPHPSDPHHQQTHPTSTDDTDHGEGTPPLLSHNRQSRPTINASPQTPNHPHTPSPNTPIHPIHSTQAPPPPSLRTATDVTQYDKRAKSPTTPPISNTYAPPLIQRRRSRFQRCAPRSSAQHLNGRKIPNGRLSPKCQVLPGVAAAPQRPGRRLQRQRRGRVSRSATGSFTD